LIKCVTHLFIHIFFFNPFIIFFFLYLIHFDKIEKKKTISVSPFNTSVLFLTNFAPKIQ
jgi:hypothetical protein